MASINENPYDLLVSNAKKNNPNGHSFEDEDVYEGAELLTNLKKSKSSQAVNTFKSKRHKSKEYSDANPLTQPLPGEDDGFKQMEFSEMNVNTDLLTKIDGDTSQQQSNANRGSGGCNGGLRTRPPLDYRYDESQRK